MKQPMTTISFSVENDIKEEIDQLSAKERRSKSDIFREMYDYYMLKKSLARLQARGRVIAARLGLETDDDIVRYMREN
jgi:metal-responsive CopG/Arc/MetJ family transcriptional regulator